MKVSSSWAFLVVAEGCFLTSRVVAFSNPSALTRRRLVSSSVSKPQELYHGPADDIASPTTESVSIDNESIAQFEADITTVLKKLRSVEKDPTIPKLFRETRLPSFSNTWSLADWERHISRWRYLDWITDFFNDRLFRRLIPQMTVLVAWSILAAWLCSKEVGILRKVTLPLTPLGLVSSFVAALLTLRSNQGLGRLNEGRVAFGKVVLYTRDMASLIVSFIYPRDPDLAIKLLRHVSLFGWLLRNFLRGEASDSVDKDVVTTMLPDPDDAAFVWGQRKKPMAVVTRIRQAIAHLAQKGDLHTAEEIALDHCVLELNHCIMTTERIRASPIPPLYTAHAGRLLIFYLFFLPLAIRSSAMMNGLGTVVASCAVGYAMLGLDETSHLLEQPFRLMPLYQLSKNSMTDVADVLVRQPPPLDSSSRPKMKRELELVSKPPYW